MQQQQPPLQPIMSYDEYCQAQYQYYVQNSQQQQQQQPDIDIIPVVNTTVNTNKLYSAKDNISSTLLAIIIIQLIAEDFFLLFRATAFSLTLRIMYICFILFIKKKSIGGTGHQLHEFLFYIGIFDTIQSLLWVLSGTLSPLYSLFFLLTTVITVSILYGHLLHIRKVLHNNKIFIYLCTKTVGKFVFLYIFGLSDKLVNYAKTQHQEEQEEGCDISYSDAGADLSDSSLIQPNTDINQLNDDII